MKRFHVGFQADSTEALEEIHKRLQSADTAIAVEAGANCCYAKSDKYWVTDPTGIAWESFRPIDTIPFYGEQRHRGAIGAEGAPGAACDTSCCPTIEPKAAAGKAAAKACCNG